MIDSSIQLLTSWLEGVRIETAQARADELRAAHFARGSSSGRQATPRELRITAAHEAAHAVAAIAQGLQVRRLVLHADGEGDAELIGDDAAALAIAQLAGPALELLYTETDESRRFVLAHSFDVTQARVNLDSCQVLTLRAASAATCVYVMGGLLRIRRLATALLALGELSGVEVSALAAGAQ